jgi:hypothetical protein
MSRAIVQYTRLYADHDGESHFEDVDVALSSVDFAAGAPPVILSEWQTAERVGFIGGTSAGWHGDAPHPTPRRQFMVWLSGQTHVQASDGETRVMGPGAVLLFDDTWGKGHVSWRDGEANLLVVQLPDERRASD